MKKLIIATAIAAATATPSFAQYYSPGFEGPFANEPYFAAEPTPGFGFYGPGFGAYAAAPGAYAYGPGVVYDNGEYLGADPDPNVRLDLLRNSTGVKDGGG